MKRPDVIPDPKRCFDPKERAELFERAKGRCEVEEDGVKCGNKIKAGDNWFAGHYPVPWSHGGRTVLSNGRCEGVCCKAKTHKEDTSSAAKIKRLRLEKGQQARLKRNGSKLKSPGFNKSLSKKMNGKVVPRKKRKFTPFHGWQGE